jgi:hypothetical protein
MNRNEALYEDMEFNRYKIPPDFEIVELHHEAALVYD